MIDVKPISVRRTARPARAAFDLWLMRAADLIGVVAMWIAAYRRHRHECRQLLALDDRQLRDLGISRIDALRASRKPFWDRR